MPTRQPVDRVYCVDCSTPQQVPKGQETCLKCEAEGTMFWLPDTNVPSIDHDDSCTYKGEPTILTETVVED